MIIIFVLLSMGCSVTKDRDTLTFFFDGVPELEAPDSLLQNPPKVNKTPDIRKDSTVVKTKIYVHKVYNRKDCHKCHKFSSSENLTNQEPALCYQCHEDYENKYKKVHGPVAAGYCSTCHEHHKSKYEHLLKIPIRELCQHCHVPGDVVKNIAHKNTSETACVDCHNSHGGNTVNMLNTAGANK